LNSRKKIGEYYLLEVFLAIVTYLTTSHMALLCSQMRSVPQVSQQPSNKLFEFHALRYQDEEDYFRVMPRVKSKRSFHHQLLLMA
jgi:hypothetical protein